MRHPRNTISFTFTASTMARYLSRDRCQGEWGGRDRMRKRIVTGLYLRLSIVARQLPISLGILPSSLPIALKYMSSQVTQGQARSRKAKPGQVKTLQRSMRPSTRQDNKNITTRLTPCDRSRPRASCRSGRRGPGRRAPRRSPRGTRRAPGRPTCRGRTGGPLRSPGPGRCG